MRPRIRVPLTPGEEALRSAWSRRTIGACALLALSMVVISGTNRGTEDLALAAHAEMPAGLQSCAQWHESASGAVSQLTQTMRDADLRQVADAVFRMRRALRNCEMGWFKLACQDYRAVVNSVPSLDGARDKRAFECAGSPQNLNDRTTGIARMLS